MSNVVFLRGEADRPNPEIHLNANLFASGAELVQLSGQITCLTDPNMKKLLVADVANEIARLNKAFADYLEACPMMTPAVL